jgi:hypothetical protein
MRLYRISRGEIEQAILAANRREREGRYHVAYKTFPERFGSSPLKVV